MENIFDTNEPPKLTSTLNVLTILTFIGCALQLIGSLFNFTQAKKSYDEKDEVIAQMQSEDMPDFAKKMMGSPEEYTEIVTKSLENRVPILLIGLVAVILCFVGALQMRKLKKQGYTLYVVGQILPFIAMFAFLGSAALSGGTLVSAVIVLIFIGLYTSQKKNLVY